MGRIKFVTVLFVSFALLLFIKSGISAQEIPPGWQLDGGVYHMISSPYMPEDRDPQASLVDDLGPYKRKRARWRLFHYDPAKTKHIELKSDKWKKKRENYDFDFGRGYWIITKNAAEIDIEGEPVLQNWIVLEHEGDGWNQIGNIFDYDFPIVSLYVARASSPWDQKQLIDEVNNDLTYVTLQEFEDGSYIDIPATGKTTLEVGKGYWLRVRFRGEGVEEVEEEDVILWFVVRQSSPLSEEIYLSEEFFETVAQQESPPDPPPAIESSSSVSFTGGSGGGSGGCFIATVAYGNYDHPSVQHLREFRDRYLLTNSLGRMFVGTYYRYSPALARFAAHHEPIKVLARFTLTPVIGLSHFVSKINPYSFFVVVACAFLGSLFLFRRGWGGDANQNFQERKKKEK